jgi:ubiquinol-cytochrome c reductase cytochrome b subunit
LDRPRNVPNRTAIGAAVMMFFFIALLNGGNDLIATHFSSSINHIMWFSRISIFVLPIITFFVTKRICLSLQRADRDLVLHGRETGRLVRLPHGEFVEVHQPLSKEEIWKLTSHEQPGALEIPEYDANGVSRPGKLLSKLRANWSASNAVQIAKPTAHELEDGSHH